MTDSNWFVKCGVDGFINWSRPYALMATAMVEAQHLDSMHPKCGPHTVAHIEMPEVAE